MFDQLILLTSFDLVATEREDGTLRLIWPKRSPSEACC